MIIDVMSFVLLTIGFFLTAGYIGSYYLSSNFFYGTKLLKENYFTDLFLPTFIGTILFFIGLIIYFYKNYSEQQLFFVLLASSIAGITFSSIVILFSEYRQRFAT
jgi:hypothetical protein